MNFRCSAASSPRRVIRAIGRMTLLFGVLGAGLGVVGVGAQEATEPDSTWIPEEALEAEVRSQLARRWEVVPEALVLEWGEPRGGLLSGKPATAQLLGTGRDGHWVASFLTEGEGRVSQSVLLRAGVLVPRPMASRSLDRGEVLAESDLIFGSRVHWGSLETVSKGAEVGWVAQRPIEDGELLVAPAVKPPLLVVSGRPVTLFWSNGVVNVNIQGTAAGSASLGETVLVRTEYGTRLEGLVEGPGLVRLQRNPTEIGR